jgi:hypothetical protein
MERESLCGGRVTTIKNLTMGFRLKGMGYPYRILLTLNPQPLTFPMAAINPMSL